MDRKQRNRTRRALYWVMFVGYAIGLTGAWLIDETGGGWVSWAVGIGSALVMAALAAGIVRLFAGPARGAYVVRNSGNATATGGGSANTGVIRRR